MSASIAHIAVGLPIEGPFDYAVPVQWQNRIAIGDRVAVNFAHAKRTGFVVGLAEASEIKTLKPVDAILDRQPLLSRVFLRCALEMSRYYGCSLGEAIEVMLPQEVRKAKTILCDPPPETLGITTDTPSQLLIHSESLTAHWPAVGERIEQTLTQGRSVIVLVPDSAHIPFVVKQLKPAMAAQAVIHDAERTPKKELENWIRLREGKSRFVVGLRSTIFAPVTALGLIVVYDEDHASYQEEKAPFYQIRDVALMRAFIERCETVFVCAAPSVELMHFAELKKFSRQRIAPERVVHKQLIDMTNFTTSKGPMAISYPLRNSLEKVMAQGGRGLIFINRRGFNTLTRCLFCGHTLRCRRCESNLVFSSTKKKMVCSKCNAEENPVKLCPKCGKDYLRAQGRGVERVVADLRRIFPAARIQGFDKEASVFPRHCHMVVATQAVFRMLGEVSFEVVGVMDIDAEFNRSDYRSSQRAFSLLSHLALLAKERVDIQTFHPDNPVLRHFTAGEHAKFYQEELKLRRELKLPPYVHLVKILLRGVDEKLVCDQAAVLYNLMAAQDVAGIDVLSAQPDGIGKLRDKYRYSLVVRGTERRATIGFVKEAIAKMKKKSGILVTVQVEG